MTNGRATLLEDDLNADIVERKSLLLQAKTFHLRYQMSKQDEQYILNYSFPIIYSIWEGFIQTSFQTYVRELNRLNLRCGDFCDQLMVYNLEIKVKQLKNYPAELSKKVNMINTLKTLMESTPFHLHPVVDTKSNVGFKVLNNILSSFNLTLIPEYIQPRVSIANELDKFLLKIRNDIAHGNNAITVKQEDLIRATDLVELLMDEVFKRIAEGFLNQKSYMRLPLSQES